MERIKSYLKFVLSIGIYTLISAQSFRQEGQYGVNYANFVKNPLQRLDVAVLIIIRVYKVQECLHRCVSDLECYSVNFAAASIDGSQVRVTKRGQIPKTEWLDSQRDLRPL